MTGWFYQLIYTLTVPLRIIMDSAIDSSVTAASKVLSKHEIFHFSSNQSEKIENARKTLRRASGVVLGLGSITLSQNPALAVAVASVIYNGSKMNRKSEKLMQERPEAEERFIQIGLFADALGALRNSVKVLMDGFGFFPEVLDPIKLMTNIIGIPLKLMLKISRQNYNKFEKMLGPERTFEAASMGVYVWKLQLLMEELSKKLS